MNQTLPTACVQVVTHALYRQADVGRHLVEPMGKPNNGVCKLTRTQLHVLNHPRPHPPGERAADHYPAQRHCRRAKHIERLKVLLEQWGCGEDIVVVATEALLHALRPPFADMAGEHLNSALPEDQRWEQQDAHPARAVCRIEPTSASFIQGEAERNDNGPACSNRAGPASRFWSPKLRDPEDADDSSGADSGRAWRQHQRAPEPPPGLRKEPHNRRSMSTSSNFATGG